jgi:hypothetical protein
MSCFNKKTPATISTDKNGKFHDCLSSSTVIECNNKIDKRKCLKCGKIFEYPCNFDVGFD